MLPVPSSEGEPKKKRCVRFPGICEDATKLGVSREHLYRVLTGKRISHSLLKRYYRLKQNPGQPPPDPIPDSTEGKPES